MIFEYEGGSLYVGQTFRLFFEVSLMQSKRRRMKYRDIKTFKPLIERELEQRSVKKVLRKLKKLIENSDRIK